MPFQEHHHPHHPKHKPFIFPSINSTVTPDPSCFFSPQILSFSSFLPTNSFFQNFTLNNGDQPEFIHPYLIKSNSNSLSHSYPSRFATPYFIYQTFNPDLTISSSSTPSSSSYACASQETRHLISSFNDLSVTLDLPSSSLRFFLVRGSPFVTFTTLSSPCPIFVSLIYAFLSVSPNSNFTKHVVGMNNNQTYIIYSSSPICFTQSGNSLLQSAADFSGVIRITFLPDPSYESILDRFSAVFPVLGQASFASPFCLNYLCYHSCPVV